jgi:hypothetical protein
MMTSGVPRMAGCNDGRFDSLAMWREGSYEDEVL